MIRPARRLARVRGRLESLPLPALVVLGVLIIFGTGAGGYYAVRTYDYVEHNNDFCLSCHLMEDPYQRFARSAHRELGCKACHRPSPIERGQMGLTQILENPDSIGVHAEVPNEVCAECHVRGDPERWASIATSAGHRIHLESDDSVLEGMRCVECHSTSVHEFAPVDRTCAQSSCHTESTIQLGAMGAFTIHCVACHAFQSPTPGDVGAEVFAEALSPDRDTCLSCHEMRLLVELPDPDPHEGACAACHDPHTQVTPAEAAESCATSACHTDVESITPFHVGVREDLLVDCLYCHQAHAFDVDGSNCVLCHQRILEDDPSALPRAPAVPSDDAAASARTDRPAAHVAARALHVDGGGFASWNVPAQVPPAFRHSEHADLACSECHDSEERHGRVTVTTLQDCRSCHHTAPASNDCSSCHTESGSTEDPYHVERVMARAAGGAVDRVLPFDHAVHAAEPCVTCHTEGLALSAAATDCASCHEDHHDPERTCRSCHVQAPTSAHPVAVAHVTCSASGCHTEGPFQAPPRTREVCLGCHQDLVDHRPEEPNCAECHALPPLRSG